MRLFWHPWRGMPKASRIFVAMPALPRLKPAPSRRRVDTYPFCEGCKDLHHEGNGRFQLGKGGMACFGKRPGTGGTMVQGPGYAALNGVGALDLDALPMTIGTSHKGQSHSLLLTTRIYLCGGA